MPGIVVTGGGGKLALEIARQRPGVVLLPRAVLDVTDPLSVDRVLSGLRPDTVVHCAGATDLAKLETDVQLGVSSIVRGTMNVVEVCAKLQARLCFPSTDYVFSTPIGRPHREDDPPTPTCRYAMLKFVSEELVRDLPTSLIMRGTMKDGVWKHPVAPTDMVETFSTREFYATTLLTLIDRRASGTFHIGQETMTAFEYARRSNPDVRPCTRAEITTLRLPEDCSLDTSKLQRFLEEHP